MRKSNYKSDLLSYAQKLDVMIEGLGEITECAKKITEKQDDLAAKALLNRISSIVESGELSKETKLISGALKDALIRYYGYMRVLEICDQNQSGDDNDPRSLSELLEDLNNLVGLEMVKEQVNNLISYQKVQIMREREGLIATKSTLHIAFIGGPGTGKTTVARIVGRIYKKIGLLSKGNFIEASRTDLIAGYQGQTALKVKEIIKKAKGGVLFIDEAYSITENDQSDSYGRECLTELTKALEDYRDDLVVIVAGYAEPMHKFFKSNPGLKSRFNTFIEFDDYTSSEMEEMLSLMCTDNNYSLSEEAMRVTRQILIKQVSSKDRNFANGRLVRNMYDDIVMNHAKRVVKIDEPSREILSLLTAEDLRGINVEVST